MNESVGYSVTINIIITFIVIIFVFISNIIIYYKSNKVGNVIVDSIEKYSGFNELSRAEIEQKLESIGYNKTRISCDPKVNEKDDNDGKCSAVDKDITEPKGYCVYYCSYGCVKDDEGNCKLENNEEVPEYYYYKIKANMMINIPIINEIVNGTVFSSTTNMYNFGNGKDVPAPLSPDGTIHHFSGEEKNDEEPDGGSEE